ncbi:MAG TPA: glycosyltransferase family 39 protein [Anaerolineaceae bacterium]|nr:glycosyltransferase family 39 protein [Anaerolineaceae bacterium]
MGEHWVLLGVAFAAFLLNLFTNGQYGFHRDELDILMNARRLDWGYVAYPPLTPFIARIGLELFGPSLIGLRSFAALAQGIVVFLAGWMARDMGGKRPAQIVAALAAFISPVGLIAGTLIQYMSFDYLWWVLVAFFLVRLFKTDDPRWWLGIGAAIGLGMMTKFTILFWVAGLVAAVLLTSARRYLRSPWLWGGVALALLVYMPNLIWQIQHGFISLDFLSAIHARDIEWGRTDGFLVEQLYATTFLGTLPLWIAGLYLLIFSPTMKPFRPLGWMFLVTFALLFFTRGRGYYLAPAYVMLLAVGSIWLEGRISGALWVLAGGIVFGLLLIKPTAPINSLLWDVAIELSDNFVEMVGWPEMTEQVAAIYATIPEAEKPLTVILVGNYGEAGALELYGAPYDLPRVIGGGNSLWERGYGDFEPQTVIVVGFELRQATKLFHYCEVAGVVTNAYDVKNEETTSHKLYYICRQPLRPWVEMWQDMRWFQ